MISRDVLNYLNAAIDAELMRLEPKIAADCGKPGWKYRDLPNMSYEIFDEFLALIGGRDQIYMLTEARRTWPDGRKTIRGQVLLNPEALERIKQYTERTRPAAGEPKATGTDA